MAGLEAHDIRVVADDRILIDGVDCHLPTGSLSAVIGPNGAGKSTLLRALAVIRRPAAGSVRFDDQDLLGMPRRKRARLAAFVEQDSAAEFPMLVWDVVALGRIPHESLWASGGAASRAIVTDALAAVGMAGFADRRFETLSGGERQRVLLARAMAQQPRLLLLDEPTNHLDIAAQLEALTLLAAMAAQGATILAALHDLTLAIAWCDAVIVMNGGRVVASGKVAETITPALIHEVYGVEASILVNPHDGKPVIAFSRSE